MSEVFTINIVLITKKKIVVKLLFYILRMEIECRKNVNTSNAH